MALHGPCVPDAFRRQGCSVSGSKKYPFSIFFIWKFREPDGARPVFAEGGDRGGEKEVGAPA
jgi:hypothetical protein